MSFAWERRKRGGTREETRANNDGTRRRDRPEKLPGRVSRYGDGRREALYRRIDDAIRESGGWFIETKGDPINLTLDPRRDITGMQANG